jgi:hypothetical protein
LEQTLLRPGGAYLLAADRPVMTMPFTTLRDHVATLLGSVEPSMEDA